MPQHVTHEVNTTTLPAGTEYLLFRRLQAVVQGVDNQLQLSHRIAGGSQDPNDTSIRQLSGVFSPLPMQGWRRLYYDIPCFTARRPAFFSGQSAEPPDNVARGGYSGRLAYAQYRFNDQAVLRVSDRLVNLFEVIEANQLVKRKSSLTEE